ncbi:prephenate dehydrogenase [Helicobacter pullorum]|uniref:Prephenate dehydrogenase n=5 Tax=Helicobacter pullorum TaxID=35818 RepID=A0A0N0LQE1_9HELI|nr:prephenate dehydrogenase [Helicobacter pullorum]HIS08635.1 prephenate dehydrogenase [Candidatus Scatomorpha intestinipullorum]KAB0574168.1 prephenate dehydrogenase [Helicobacter pullorum NCTC 12824]KPH50741.1 prephenate dehydrogenase [Helicobacter pullorum]KPH53368.1 prephenate dehydrogenase [Helicobacter pullorum]KPH53592.1 prephenate dehydrogenase [Helicobacter pullorum]
MQAGIIGLGLIGGSLGLALKEIGMFKRIVGLDSNEIHLQQALSLGLVDEGVDLDEIKLCDVIFLATPVEAILEILPQLVGVAPHTTIIDLGSTKHLISQSIPKEIRKNFVCAHPMSGTENFGPKAAFKELLPHHIIVLTDLEQSGEFQAAMAKEIFIALKMNIIKMDSKSHDNHAAFISHLPHIISYALANTVLSQQNPKDILALAGGGFKSMVRIAKSSPKMWSDVSKQNKQELLKSFEAFQKELDFAINLIQNDKWKELEEWMAKANSLYAIF